MTARVTPGAGPAAFVREAAGPGTAAHADGLRRTGRTRPARRAHRLSPEKEEA
ncbi:hypothetical protein GCM10019017_27020 [Streptomyces showdoensis]